MNERLIEVSPGYCYPGWIPCLTCDKSLEAHVDLKCPFEATNFSPKNPEVLARIFRGFEHYVNGYTTQNLQHVTPDLLMLYNLAARSVLINDADDSRIDTEF